LAKKKKALWVAGDLEGEKIHSGKRGSQKKTTESACDGRGVQTSGGFPVAHDICVSVGGNGEARDREKGLISKKKKNKMEGIAEGKSG